MRVVFSLRNILISIFFYFLFFFLFYLIELHFGNAEIFGSITVTVFSIAMLYLFVFTIFDYLFFPKLMFEAVLKSTSSELSFNNIKYALILIFIIFALPLFLIVLRGEVSLFCVKNDISITRNRNLWSFALADFSAIFTYFCICCIYVIKTSKK